MRHVSRLRFSEAMLTSMWTLLTEPADSATKILVEGERGSKAAAAILDLRTIGLPNLLPDLAARLSLLLWAALRRGVSALTSVHLGWLISPTYSDSKKCRGSEEFIFRFCVD